VGIKARLPHYGSMRRFVVLAAAALAGALPAILSAQVLPARVTRRSAGMGFEMSDGEPISYFLEHSRELDLTEQQRVLLMDIRRRLRQTNAPFMRQLDSLRELVGVSLEPRSRLMQSDLDALQRLEKLSAPVVDSIRANNQSAQAEARSVLLETQRTRLDSLIIAGRDSTRGRGRRPPGTTPR